MTECENLTSTNNIASVVPTYCHPPALRMAEKAADFVDSPHTFIFERNPYVHTHSTIVMSKHTTFKNANRIFQLLNFLLLIQNVSPGFNSNKW